MRIKIRLKGMKDVDLLCLQQTPGYFLERAFQTALYAYVEQKELRLPCPIAPPVIDLDERFIYVTISNKRTDVIQFIDSLPPGSKTTVIKLILRNALQKPFIDYLTCENTIIRSDKDETEEAEIEVRQKKTPPAKKKAQAKAPAQTKPDPQPEETKTKISEDDFGFINVY